LRESYFGGFVESASNEENMNITREELKGSYSEGEALAIYHCVKASNDFKGFILQFMDDEDYQVARNAMWGLTKATDHELAQLQPLYHTLIDHAMATENSSVRRLTLNIIERLKMTEDDLRSDFLDFCLDHMVNPEEYPGIQTLCMKIAFRISQFYPELMEEFMRAVEGIEIAYYKPAVKCLRSRILSGKFK